MNSDLIYHISTSRDWETAQKTGYYTTDSLLSEGFIHASNQAQVARSANLFFKGQSNLWVLHIVVNRLTAKLVFENTTGGSELFPHIYGTINLDAVSQVSQLMLDESGSFVF
ncbi:MAG: DUF952 domain-containing protein [Microscillaceae bacterium]|jgi:uncharacterized protein (DUF952 family)|nr:DUF952 domain-containing protein [Microscillaceae bacterium]